MTQIEENKKEFIDLLNSVERDGVIDLVDYLLNETDFFKAPASSIYHGSYEGGLLDHSLNVYYELDALVDYYNIRLPKDSIILVGLLHDICKVNTYKKAMVNVPPDKSKTGKWEKVPKYKKEEELRIGHGAKSAILISQYIKLNPAEMEAIYWHMGSTDLSMYSTISNMSETYNKNTLAFLLYIADMAATYITENKNLF